ncbi:MAG: hypothetical protein EPO28_01300 [Saprospiraceae bacterium]|nr:MAG: hypothetical protein EPO28_01300 [Saprospiraceae bacterium]
MKRLRFLALVLPLFLLTACNKEEDLPTPDAVMVKFVNKTGKDIADLTVSRAEVGSLKKGSTSGEYFRYEALGQQFGYALVETVGMAGGTRYFTASACRGVCGTPSAPHGIWLTPGYHKISVHISDELGGDYLTFRMMD